MFHLFCCCEEAAPESAPRRRLQNLFACSIVTAALLLCAGVGALMFNRIAAGLAACTVSMFLFLGASLAYRWAATRADARGYDSLD